MQAAVIPPRIEWLDIAKGVAILVVVFGHVVALPMAAKVAPVAMPMFFFLSGYVFRQRPMVEFLWRRGHGLLVPYLAFMAVIAVLWVALAIASGDLVTLAADPRFDTLRGLLKATHYNRNYTALWFLPALFVAQLIYNLLLNELGAPTGRKVAAAVLVVVAAGVAIGGDQRFGWLGIAPVALLFVWGGSVYRTLSLPAWAIIPAVMLTAATLYLGSPFNMRTATYGVPVFTLIAALASCHVVAVFCRYLAGFNRLASVLMQLGATSLVIMAVHVTFAMRMTYSLGLAWYVVFPASIVLSYGLALAFQHSGWIGHWLLLGRVPSPERFALLGPRLTARLAPIRPA